MRALLSTSSAVHENLAWEEALLDAFEDEGPTLFFCANESAIVLGKNQNPWRETNPRLLLDEHIALARRISGGGTVYHDAGNLNYSLILSRSGYHTEDVFHRVIRAFATLGIDAELLPGNSLGVAGRKFSGNAFCFRRSAVLHHGTILMNSDAQRLHRFLKPVLQDIQTKAVQSKPACVVNLCEVRPSLSSHEVQCALAREFSGSDVVEPRVPPAGSAVWRELVNRNRSWTWTHGYTPKFRWTLRADKLSLVLDVEDGRISHAIAQGINDEAISELSGCAFVADEICAHLKRCSGLDELIQPVLELRF